MALNELFQHRGLSCKNRTEKLPKSFHWLTLTRRVEISQKGSIWQFPPFLPSKLTAREIQLNPRCWNDETLETECDKLSWISCHAHFLYHISSSKFWLFYQWQVAMRKVANGNLPGRLDWDQNPPTRQSRSLSSSIFLLGILIKGLQLNSFFFDQIAFMR
jgi:hypothetical protein